MTWKGWKDNPKMQQTCPNCGKLGHRGSITVHMKYCGTTLRRDQFFAKLDKTSSPIGCWLWTGHVEPVNGYGWAASVPRSDRTHRVAWMLANGPIPKGACVLHKCDVRHCCNPDHLFLGDKQVNSDDKYQKGRQWSKLKPEQVREIRNHLADGVVPKEVAKRYGVSVSTIYSINRGHHWARLE